MDTYYKYEGLEASLYDQLDELSEFEDYSFYRWIVENGDSPVLDVGCGTGRILIPMAQDGIDIDGLEASPEMTTICREKVSDLGLKPKIHEADMRSFSIDRKYGTILIPGFTIQLLSEEDALASLTRCREHLKPKGQVVVSSFVPWEMIHDGRESSDWYERKRFETEEGDLLAKAMQSWRLDHCEQKLELLNRYHRYDQVSGEILQTQETSMLLMWRLPYDLMKLLEKAGFESPELYGDFRFDGCDPDSESLVCVGRQ
ncbi:class I SAM-dependent methyltransferase [Puniceicoccaceae bacterium K14]|nr:class I SAM-dependent methyltransferase [Puniceicoccaceae bacterium K14]